jgi:hypothetical protein
MDTATLFQMRTIGANEVVSGIVALMATLDALLQPVSIIKEISYLKFIQIGICDLLPVNDLIRRYLFSFYYILIMS